MPENTIAQRSWEHRKELLAAAQLFCKLSTSGLPSYTDVAKAFGKPWGNYAKRLISEAIAEGIVSFHYTLTPPRHEGLETDLIEKYPHLKRVIVVPSTKDYDSHRKLLGSAAAAYLETECKSSPSVRIGLSGGHTVYEMIQALPHRERDISIYPIDLVGRGPEVTHVDPMVLITQLWLKSGSKEGRAHYVTVPPFEKGTSLEKVRSEYQKLRRRPKIRSILRDIENLDMVFASLGPLDEIEYIKLTNFTTQELLNEMGVTRKKVRNLGVVGDIGYTFITVDGESSPALNPFLTIGAERLRTMSRRSSSSQVVVLAGTYKIDPLRAVLRGKLCNVLITDELSADELKRGK